MKLKIIWIAVFLMILVHFFIQFKYFAAYNSTDLDDRAIFAIDLVGSLITIVLFGLTPGLLISLIPFKKMRFSEKIKIVTPVCFLIIMIIIVANFGYSAYLQEIKGIKFTPYRN